MSASLAQLVEHALRKRMVVGSIPTGGFIHNSKRARSVFNSKAVCRGSVWNTRWPLCVLHVLLGQLAQTQLHYDRLVVALALDNTPYPLCIFKTNFWITTGAMAQRQRV